MPERIIENVDLFDFTLSAIAAVAALDASELTGPRPDTSVHSEPTGARPRVTEPGGESPVVPRA